MSYGIPFTYTICSKKTFAKWSASIFVHTRASSLTVDISGQTHPVLKEEYSEGHCPLAIDVSALHAKHLPHTVNLGKVLDSLKRTLEGGWEFAAPGGESYGLTNPLFTRQGDLVMQLCKHKVSSGANATLTPTVSYSETIKVHANLGTHTHNGIASRVTEQGSHNGHVKITHPNPSPVNIDRDLNLTTATIKSPASKAPNTPSLDVSASIFSPKATKSKSNGKMVKVDMTKIESIPASLSSNAGLNMPK